VIETVSCSHEKCLRSFGYSWKAKISVWAAMVGSMQSMFKGMSEEIGVDWHRGTGDKADE
jgi:hypothetical protein